MINITVASEVDSIVQQMQMNGHSAHVQLEHKLMSETPQDFWL